MCVCGGGGGGGGGGGKEGGRMVVWGEGGREGEGEGGMGREGGRNGGRMYGSVWGGREDGGKEVTNGGVWREGGKEGKERGQMEEDIHVHFPPSFVGTESLGCSLSVPLPPSLLLPPPRSPSGVSPSKEASPHVMGRQLLGAVDQATLRASLSSRARAEVRESAPLLS